jgi:hypothetical protein
MKNPGVNTKVTKDTKEEMACTLSRFTFVPFVFALPWFKREIIVFELGIGE